MSGFDGLTLTKRARLAEASDLTDDRVRRRLASWARQKMEDDQALDWAIEEIEAEGMDIAYRSVSDFGAEHLFDPLTFMALDCDAGYMIAEISSETGATYQVLWTRTGNPMGAVFLDEGDEPFLPLYDGIIGGFEPPEEHKVLCQALDALRHHAAVGESLGSVRASGRLEPKDYLAIA